MKCTVFFFLCLFLLAACHHSGPGRSRLTVIYYSNDNPGYREIIDTIWKEKEIDKPAATIDLVFAQKNFPIPEYIPTGGFFKNQEQQNECNRKPDTLLSKCYEYDREDRVLKLMIHQKMYYHTYIYSYNAKGQVLEINSSDHEVYTPLYNTDGSLRELTKKGGFLEKRLVFIYQ